MGKSIDVEIASKLEEEMILLRSGLYEAATKLLNDGGRSMEVTTGPSGRDYQLAFSAFFDDKKLRTIRVTGSVYEIKESRWWSMNSYVDSPILSDSYIIAPDNLFVGE